MNNNPHKKLTDRAVRANIRDAAKKLYNQIPGVTGIRPRDILDYLYGAHTDPPVDYDYIGKVLSNAGYRCIRISIGWTRGASWYVNAADAKKMIPPDPEKERIIAERKRPITLIQQPILTAAEQLIKTHPGGIRSIDVVEAMYGACYKRYENPNKTRTRHVARVLRTNGWISVRPVRSGHAIFTKPESAGTSET